MPVFTAAYVSIATGLAAETGSFSDSSFTPPPVWVDALSWFFAGLASFVLYQHIFVAPFPTEDDEMFKVTQKIGRWVFLTRQTLALQAIHGIVSLLSSQTFPALVKGTHATAVLLGGLGLFVTSQYFVLVANHPDFLLSCKKWRDRGLPFRALMHFTHIPCGVLSLLDLAVIKNRQLLLSQTPPFHSVLCYYFVYVILYVLLLHINHALTTEWPYGLFLCEIYMLFNNFISLYVSLLCSVRIVFPEPPC